MDVWKSGLGQFLENDDEDVDVECWMAVMKNSMVTVIAQKKRPG